MAVARGNPAQRIAREATWKDFRDAIEYYYEQRWTEGLPVIPPTEEEVKAMMSTVDRDPLEILGQIPPRLGTATVETVATCAVMAGCKPEYFPVVLAAIEAVLVPKFNLTGIQATGNQATPLCIVSGPIVKELEMNYGTNLFGYGSRANATIGRAIRLVLLIQGAAYPDTGTKSPFGHPGRYTFCIAEAPSDPGHDLHNPWGPLHVDLGLDAENGVTMIGANAPFIAGGGGADAKPGLLLQGLAARLAQTSHVRVGGDVTLVINPLAARILMDDGWSRWDVKLFMYEHAREPMDVTVSKGFAVIKGVPEEELGGHGPDPRRWPRWLDVGDEKKMVPALKRPEHLILVVAGGIQFVTMCAILQGWGTNGAWAITKPIRRKGK